MISGLLIGLLIEAPDEVFEDVAHRDVRDGVRVQVHGGDLLDDFKEPVGFLQLLDLFVELELLDDLPSTGGEPGHVVAEIGGELVGVAEKLSRR